jgi:hypothetical protein
MKTVVAAVAIAAAMLSSSAYAQKMNSDDLKWSTSASMTTRAVPPTP